MLVRVLRERGCGRQVDSPSLFALRFSMYLLLKQLIMQSVRIPVRI